MIGHLFNYFHLSFGVDNRQSLTLTDWIIRPLSQTFHAVRKKSICARRPKPNRRRYFHVFSMFSGFGVGCWGCRRDCGPILSSGLNESRNIFFLLSATLFFYLFNVSQLTDRAGYYRWGRVNYVPIIGALISITCKLFST